MKTIWNTIQRIARLIGGCYTEVTLLKEMNEKLLKENAFLEQQNQIIHDQLKLLEEQLAPLPKPIERRVLTGQEVFQIIRDKFPDGDIHLGDSWHDGVYSLCDIEDVEALLDVDETNHLKYVKSKFDCENFAALLWGQFNTPKWAPFAIGYMWTDKHGMIMCIDANEDLWLVEPQTDARRSNLDSWQGTDLRFVII